MPFAGYTDFAECVRQNQQADDPDAYCGSIKHEVEDKMQKAINSASYLHQMVRAALTTVAKGHDPVKEEGKKKLTESEGTSAEGAQDDQAFAVAFGPDNYDKLVKRIIAAPYQGAYNAAGAILKALENKQFNFPGNIEEHMKKAHAAIHGREMWDARYSDVCDLITQARKILHSIEKTAEVSQGGSGMMVVGKADPGQDEKPKTKPRPTRPNAYMSTPSQHRTVPGPTRSRRGAPRPAMKAKPGGPPIAREDYPKIPSGPGYGQRPRPVGKAGDYQFPRGKPPAKPKPKAGVGNLPQSGFPHRGAAYKAVQKAVQAVRGR